MNRMATLYWNDRYSAVLYSKDAKDRLFLVLPFVFFLLRECEYDLVVFAKNQCRQLRKKLYQNKIGKGFYGKSPRL